MTHEFTKNTGIPLDTDILEEVPVRKLHTEYTEEDGKPVVKTSIKTVLEQQTVRYIHAPKEKLRCADGVHSFTCIDNHRYLFACKNCRFVRKVYPTTYIYEEDTGALIHRVTDKRI